MQLVEYIALEDVRDPDLRVVRVATAKVPASTHWHTVVRPDENNAATYGDYRDPESAFRGHRAICRAVRLGHDLNEEIAA